MLLLSNEIIQSPFMTGIFKQKIFLPESNYTQEEWGLLLKHELVHCKIRIIFFADLYLFYALCIGLIRLFIDYQIILLK